MQCSQELASHHYQVIVCLLVTTSCLVLLYINQSTHSLLSQHLRIAESSSAPKTMCKCVPCTNLICIKLSGLVSRLLHKMPKQHSSLHHNSTPAFCSLVRPVTKHRGSVTGSKTQQSQRLQNVGIVLPEVFEEKTHRIESEKQSCLRPHRKMSKDDFHWVPHVSTFAIKMSLSWQQLVDTVQVSLVLYTARCAIQNSEILGNSNILQKWLDSLLCSVDESSDLVRHEIHSILVDGSGECYSCESSKVKLQRHLLLQPKFRCFMALLSRSLKSPE